MLQTLSSRSWRFRGLNCFSPSLTSRQTFSMGLRSGLCGGQDKHLRWLFTAFHSATSRDLWQGVPSYWNQKLSPKTQTMSRRNSTVLQNVTVTSSIQISIDFGKKGSSVVWLCIPHHKNPTSILDSGDHTILVECLTMSASKCWTICLEQLSCMAMLPKRSPY